MGELGRKGSEKVPRNNKLAGEVHLSKERERKRDQRVLLCSPCYEMLMATIWEKS